MTDIAEANKFFCYLDLLVDTPDQQRATVLREDLANIREAWWQAVNRGQARLWSNSLDIFVSLLQRLGLIDDALYLIDAAIEQLETDDDARATTSQQEEMLAHLLYHKGRLIEFRVGKRRTVEIRKRLLSLTKDPVLQARTSVELGDVLAELGLWEEADAHFNRARAVSQKIGDRKLIVYTDRARTHAHAVHFRGDFRDGIQRMENALALLKDEPDTIEDCCFVCFTLALLGVRYGDYALSRRYAELELEYARQTQDHLFTILAMNGIGLAEQFAGMYADAVTHFKQGLAMAGENNLREDMGIFKANLCLTLRQLGELEEALAYGRAAMEDFQAAGAGRFEGMLRNRLGHTLSVLGRWSEAYEMYNGALAVWKPLNHPNENEARAGLALAASHLGQPDEARELVDGVLAFVGREKLVGMVEPVLMLLNCAEVLGQTGQGERVGEALQFGAEWIEMVAGRISDDEMIGYFLARPDNQRLREQLSQR